ncbi:MAG: hypothetical protein KC457_07325 [Myxococcales bacterium]|nr:hypothetical protein [Myxococcales bacterium]
MTTEEFTGHLLAALHGPQAPQIAVRVFDLILDLMLGPAGALDQAVFAKLSGVVDGFVRVSDELADPERRALLALMLLVHEQDRLRSTGPSMGRELFAHAKACEGLVDEIREIIAEMSPEQAEKLGISLAAGVARG